MGKEKRNEYLQRKGISEINFLPERIYSINGIRAIPRKNTSDFAVLFLPREEEIKPYLRMQPNETFVDVGANVGQYSLMIAKDYGWDNNIRVISIEAHPENYKALCKNIEINHFSEKILAINKAVSDHKGIAKLYQASDPRIHGLSLLYSLLPQLDGKLVEEKSSLEIECDTLDNILVGQKVDVMKIDIEGAEIQALNGASDTFKQLRLILVEIHGDNFEKVNQILQTNNFKTKMIVNPVIKKQGFVIGLK